MSGSSVPASVPHPTAMGHADGIPNDVSDPAEIGVAEWDELRLSHCNGFVSGWPQASKAGSFHDGRDKLSEHLGGSICIDAENSKRDPACTAQKQRNLV